MKTHRLPTSTALALLMLASCGKAEPPPGRGVVSRGNEAVARAAPYRVAGVGLMMPSARARDALRASGYEEEKAAFSTGQEQQQSFEDQVAERASCRRPEHPTMVPAFQKFEKGREKIQVWFGAFPGGAAVTRVAYQNEGPSPSPAETRAEFEKRYGRPTKASASGYADWCEPAPCGSGSARLTAGGSRIDLAGPSGLTNQMEIDRRIDAAARARSGSKPGSF